MVKNFSGDLDISVSLAIWIFGIGSLAPGYMDPWFSGFPDFWLLALWISGSPDLWLLALWISGSLALRISGSWLYGSLASGSLLVSARLCSSLLVSARLCSSLLVSARLCSSLLRLMLLMLMLVLLPMTAILAARPYAWRLLAAALSLPLEVESPQVGDVDDVGLIVEEVRPRPRAEVLPCRAQAAPLRQRCPCTQARILE